MDQTKEADVIITNPTHIALALKYDSEAMRAPELVAKGVGKAAVGIEEIAEQNGIPIVEHETIAQCLSGIVDIKQEIPAKHYQAVAEILAYVFRLKDPSPGNSTKEEDETPRIVAQPQKDTEICSESVRHLLLVDPLVLEIGHGLISLVDKEQGGEFADRVGSIRELLASEWGMVFPPIHIECNLQLNPLAYQVLLKGVRVAGSELMVGHYMAICPEETTPRIDGIRAIDPASNLPGIWIKESQKNQAEDLEYTVLDSATIVATHLQAVLKKHLPELIGLQETKELLDNLHKSHPVPVQELVPKVLSLGAVRIVLQNLLREQVSLKDLLTIVETLVDYAPVSKDPELLTEYVRHKLARSITAPHTKDDGVLSVITMVQKAEDALVKSIQNTDQGSYLSVDPDVADKIITSIKTETDKAIAQNIQPILLTSPTLRRHIKRIVEYSIPSLMVLSYSELSNEIRFMSMGEVGFAHAS